MGRWCKKANRERWWRGRKKGGRRKKTQYKRRGDIQHFMNNGRKKRCSAQAEHGGRFFVFFTFHFYDPFAADQPYSHHVRRASSEPTRHRSLRVRVLMISCDEIFILMQNGRPITSFRFHSRCTPFFLVFFFPPLWLVRCKTEYGDLPLDEDVTRLSATEDLSLLLIAGMEKSIILKVNQLLLFPFLAIVTLTAKKEFSSFLHSLTFFKI